METKKKSNNNVTSRIGEKFSAEIEDIKKLRLKSGIDKKKKSTRQLTDLITHHKYWSAIKKDTCEIDLDKKKDE